ncbi:MAG: 3-dehydroquinate synthase [Litorivicinus sp.]
MQKVVVELDDRSYPIEIGGGLLDSERLAQVLPHSEIMIVTDSNVAPLYLQQVQAQLAHARVLVHVIPAGESSKRLSELEMIWSELLHARFSRRCALVALGGGVVGDMTGFAAACYQRGVDFVQLPTTLLAQVDSSVGGKTAVNHPQGKNMIGAFHQPQAVLIDTDTLRSLPPREFAAGMAEVIKYGALGDLDFLNWLGEHMQALKALQPEALAQAVQHACQMKADIVAADEREAGQRALLNLGHTFGHAIEAQEQYVGLLHGEGVAVGMVMASDLSVRLGWSDAQSHERLVHLIESVGLPVMPPACMTPDNFMHHMGLDKKVDAGQLRLVLPKPMGRAIVTADFEPAALQACLMHFCQGAE